MAEEKTQPKHFTVQFRTDDIPTCFSVNPSYPPILGVVFFHPPLCSKGHDLEEALLALEVVLQGGLGVVDGGVPQCVAAHGELVSFGENITTIFI